MYCWEWNIILALPDLFKNKWRQLSDGNLVWILSSGKKINPQITTSNDTVNVEVDALVGLRVDHPKMKILFIYGGAMKLYKIGHYKSMYKAPFLCFWPTISIWTDNSVRYFYSFLKYFIKFLLLNYVLTLFVSILHFCTLFYYCFVCFCYLDYLERFLKNGITLIYTFL